MSFKIQKAGQKEVRPIVIMLKEAFDINEVKTFKLIESRIDSDRHLILMAKDESKAIGIIECSVMEKVRLWGNHSRVVIKTLYVVESKRREGIAKKLLETASFWFSTVGVDSVEFELPNDNKELLEFFKSMGYNDTAIVMSKEVKPLD